MSRRTDRAGGIGLQLAALVDLLFVITFLLICDREALLQRKIQKYQQREKAAEQERKDAMKQAAKMAEEAIQRAVPSPPPNSVPTKDVTQLQQQLMMSREREQALQKELHSLFNFILTGMRKGNPAAAPPVERVLGAVPPAMKAQVLPPSPGPEPAKP